jgi:hypothetical protein
MMGYFFRASKVGRLEHQAVEVGLAVAGFDLDGRGRNPAVCEQLGDVLLGDFHHDLAVAVADHRGSGAAWGGVGVDEVAAVGET